MPLAYANIPMGASCNIFDFEYAILAPQEVMG